MKNMAQKNSIVKHVENSMTTFWACITTIALYIKKFVIIALNATLIFLKNHRWLNTLKTIMERLQKKFKSVMNVEKS